MRYILIILVAFFLFNFSSCVVHTRSTAVVVKSAPKYSKVVIIKGKRYHYWHGKYYKKTRKGYVLTAI